MLTFAGGEENVVIGRVCLQLVDGISMTQIGLYMHNQHISGWMGSGGGALNRELTALQLTVVVPITLMIPLKPAMMSRLSYVMLS